MNPLLKKEIRLVLPAWLAVLLLELCLPWLGKDQDMAIAAAPIFFFFGIILLAVDSFGREFSLGTFSSMMAQPVERGQIWRTKISVLFVAGALVFLGYFISCELRLHATLADNTSTWYANGKILKSDFGTAMGASVAFLFVALTGGLWTALLLRQVSAAVWITFLAPGGVLMLVILVMSLLFKNTSDHVTFGVLYGVAAVYIVFAFWLARRLLLRAEDAGWTGGVVSFSKWRYFERTAQSGVSVRQHRPMVSLLKKEFQLHSISLFGAAVLLGLHFLVFFLRATYAKFHPNTLASVCSDCFWFFWLIIPLAMGCTAVAEERKLGVADSQFGLPVSRRRQFWIKLVPLMIVGVLLGGVVPFLLEVTASWFGAPSEFFKLNHHIDNGFGPYELSFPLSILGSAAGLAWVGFFASTLARNFLQALSIAIVSIVVYCFFGALITYLGAENISFFGLMPIPWVLIVLIGVPTVIGMFLWLACRNFISYHENARLWWRNIGGMAGTLLFVLVSSCLIYARTWELFMPADLPHGMPKLSLTSQPVLQAEMNVGGSLQVRLPDGRVWCDNLSYLYLQERRNLIKAVYSLLVHPQPVSAGPRAEIDGSNWVSVASSQGLSWIFIPTNNAASFTDTVGVKADGTLWVSREAKPFAWTGADMIQFGSESDWRQVMPMGQGLVLLKSNGTLWQWGTNQPDWRHWQVNWPTVRHSPMRQIGTNSDWQEFFPLSGGYVRKNDGTVWRLNPTGSAGIFKPERRSDLDPLVAKASSGLAGVGQDGSLWVPRQTTESLSVREGAGLIRVGRETNWLAAAMATKRLVALKSDGTLWQWDMSSELISADTVLNPATRLGTHQDWVAVTTAWDGVVSLAADGSLWLWSDLASNRPYLLKESKQPQRLANIFAAN